MSTNSNLYRTLWRWHFYAGLLSLPIVMLLSITGGIYLFKPQIEALREHKYTSVYPAGEATVAPNKLIATAISALPSGKFQSLRIPKKPGDAVRISVFSEGERHYVYLNPVTLDILAVHQLSGVFIEWIKELHGELLAGRTGSIVIELAASWAIVLIISGLYLWWPRNGRLAGVLYPRLKQGRRKLWRDLHAVTGFWLSFFILFILISGLPWTSVWGAAFKEARTAIVNMSSQDWESNRASTKKSWGVKAVEKYDLTPEVLSKATGLNYAWPTSLSIDSPENNTWKLASNHQNRMVRKTAWIDGTTATLSRETSFSDRKIVDKVVAIGISAHEGHLFGLANQLLGLITVLGMLLMCVSSFILWRKRKPIDTLGAPLPAVRAKFPKILLLPILLLPTLLVSFIVVLFVERFVLPRLPRINQWLGA